MGRARGLTAATVASTAGFASVFGTTRGRAQSAREAHDEACAAFMPAVRRFYANAPGDDIDANQDAMDRAFEQIARFQALHAGRQGSALRADAYRALLETDPPDQSDAELLKRSGIYRNLLQVTMVAGHARDPERTLTPEVSDNLARTGHIEVLASELADAIQTAMRTDESVLERLLPQSERARLTTAVPDHPWSEDVEETFCDQLHEICSHWLTAAALAGEAPFKVADRTWAAQPKLTRQKFIAVAAERVEARRLVALDDYEYELAEQAERELMEADETDGA